MQQDRIIHSIDFTYSLGGSPYTGIYQVGSSTRENEGEVKEISVEIGRVAGLSDVHIYLDDWVLLFPDVKIGQIKYTNG